MRGGFRNGCPVVAIGVLGALGQNSAEKEAILDTGFNGYLTLPFAEAFPLGLILIGTQSSRLADKSISHSFVCLGTVVLDGRRQMVPISGAGDSDILIGTELLKKFQKRMEINFATQTVEVMDNVPPDVG